MAELDAAIGGADVRLADPDVIIGCDLSETEAGTHPALVRQLREIEHLRRTVGCLPLGTHISWRDETMSARAAGVIIARNDYGYRVDSGAFVLWKTHEVRVEPPPGPAAPTATPEETADMSIPRGTQILSEADLALRRDFVEAVDRERSEPGAPKLAAVVADVADRPEFAALGKHATVSNYSHWRRNLCHITGRGKRICPECGKPFTPRGPRTRTCPECILAETAARVQRPPAPEAPAAAAGSGPVSAPPRGADPQPVAAPAAAAGSEGAAPPEQDRRCESCGTHFHAKQMFEGYCPTCLLKITSSPTLTPDTLLDAFAKDVRVQIRRLFCVTAAHLAELPDYYRTIARLAECARAADALFAELETATPETED